MTAQDAFVLVQIERGVALLTLNKPERRNAWSLDMEREYFAALKAAEKDSAVGAIVLTGAGKTFCPGMDTEMLEGIAEGDLDTRPQDRQPITLATTIGKPVIAAINGACAGVGFIHAMYCDIRFAAAGAKFSTSFTRRGIMAEQGISWMLSQVAGTANALELLLSARTFVSEEALALGLVHRVVDPDQLIAVTLDYAADLAANCSPLAMATTKEQVYRAPTQTLDGARREAIELWNSRHKEHPDFREGIASYIERRAPRFHPLDVSSLGER